uniref:CxC2-like cysteine cluster KDZ transposase-associated domain-containing protein n=1 Tax=Mycena chlorophos TaxID=658473 RepID=A0ABQ0L8S5_MYCCL|nr:predicted protein [Mycena chlorophos]
MPPPTLLQRQLYFDESMDLDLDMAPTDEHSSISLDARRATTSAFNLSPRKTRPPRVEETDPRLAGWTPVDEADIDQVSAIANTISALDISLDEEVTKLKRYASDDPMAVWKRIAPLFLDEMARSDGLAGFTQCAFCFAEVAGPEVAPPLPRFFRCKQCGEHLFCEECLKSQHRRHPLHDICVRLPFTVSIFVLDLRFQEWTGEFWTEASLYHHNVKSGGVAGLGAVYQLGHGGDICPCPGARRAMVVVDVNGVFNVDTQFCDCKNTDGTDAVEQLLRNKWYPATTVTPSTCATFNVLDLFRLLRALGDVNTQDFVRSLEALRDPTHTNATPDRYREFGRMARQYDFLKRMKRAGHAYEADGMETTKPGGLAVLCWACPDADRNLPLGWERANYLYRLNIAIDANFRLKNRLRPNTHDDQSLGSGLGYFVESNTYKEHLKRYVTEKDAASARATDFANVDWILLCTLWAERLLEYGFAYDIICRWMIHFFDRLNKIRQSDVDTSTLATGIDEADLYFGLPVWHAGAHQAECRAHLALAYMLGMGKTDGEAMERIWASLNPASWATKEMGVGARHDVLEDKIDRMNYEKNLTLGKSLARKLIVAIAERKKQGLEFAELDKSVAREKRRQWRQRMDAWYEDEDSDSPFILAGGEASGPSQRAIAEELRQAELEDACAGHVPFVEGNMTATAFVQAGLQLEELQRRIQAALSNTSSTATRSSEIQELRMSLLKKIKSFERLQLTYMPGVLGIRDAHEAKRNPDQPPPQPEVLRLFLPSDLSDDERHRACVRRIIETEVGLRRGQCADALVVLRARLFAHMHLIWFRDRNMVGQQQRTRSVTLMARLLEAIARLAAKYRAARAALVELKGDAFVVELGFLKLEDSDLTGRLENESDAIAMERLRSADGSRATRSEPNARRNAEHSEPNTRRLAGSVSWIWKRSEGQEMHDSVRVEWSKARARKQRWEEEVELVREEMKRVLRSLRWEQMEWQERANEVQEDVADVEITAGLRAYALRQVALRRRIAESFYAEWGKSVATAVRDAMREDGKLYRTLIHSAFGTEEVDGEIVANQMGELERFTELERRLALSIADQ